MNKICGKAKKSNVFLLNKFNPVMVQYVKAYRDYCTEAGEKLSINDFLALFPSKKNTRQKLMYKFLTDVKKLMKEYKKEKTYSVKIRLRNFGFLGRKKK